MHIFMARQPIFDTSNNVVGYELLFRNNNENVYNSIDGNEATLNVIANSFIEFDFKTITDNKKAFINFTEKLIKDGTATILPNDSTVIEILEDIEPTEEIIEACKKLKEKGYTLALDDFVLHEKYNKLMEFVDIVKVDFLATKGSDRKKVFDLLKINSKIKFLAEKVENIEEYNEAEYYGYTYFQGYYFSKPVILSTKSIPSGENTALKILRLVNHKDFNFTDLEELILKDVGLSYKLTKLIKSSAYCIKSNINSIKYAITFLGEKEIAKWLHIVLINELKGNKPNELIKISLLRAKFCELICSASQYKEKTFLAYMTGLFSVMDAILNCSMESVIEEMYVCDEMKEALIGKENFLNIILNLVISYDRGQWEDVEIYSNKLNVDVDKISQIYLDALNWVDNTQG